MNRLKDKIVLITGAAGAIGKAVTEAASAEGARAITSDLPGRQGATHTLDVTEELDWLRVISDIGRTHGRIDGLVNAAGVAALGNIEETTTRRGERSWRSISTARFSAASTASRCSSSAAARSSICLRSRG